MRLPGLRRQLQAIRFPFSPAVCVLCNLAVSFWNHRAQTFCAHAMSVFCRVCPRKSCAGSQSIHTRAMTTRYDDTQGRNMWILPRRFAHMTIFDIKLIVAYGSVIYTPRSRIAQYVAVAKGANVHIAFCNRVSVPDTKLVPATAAMIYLPGTHVAAHSVTTKWTSVFEKLFSSFFLLALLLRAVLGSWRPCTPAGE